MMFSFSSEFSVRRSTLALVLGLLACGSVAAKVPASAGSDALAGPNGTSLLHRRELTAGPDLSSLLQRPEIPRVEDQSQTQTDAVVGPQLIPLRRESVPVYRRGKVASFKTSYSGILSVGTPAQEFRMVFDTGSGHIVLPAAECRSESCLVHRTFNMSTSSTAVPINSNGKMIPDGELADQVTIGFGTGEITGEFVRDTVCFNRPSTVIAAQDKAREAPPAEGPKTEAETNLDANAVATTDATKDESRDNLCVEMSVILAVEMSTQPFKTFHFDGILGLGLDGLAMNRNFSSYDMLMSTGKMGHNHFGVFLTEGEDGEESEIAFGGFNQKRLLDDLKWAPVAMADLGYWQIRILAVRINGVELDVCKDGTCRGVVDTGTSHLGVPAPFDGEFADLLTREAGDLVDCRNVDAPDIEIVLAERTLTLHPWNYMRRLPLREGVSVSSPQGVYVPSAETNATLGMPSSADAPALATAAADNATAGNNTTPPVEASAAQAQAAPASTEAAPPTSAEAVPASTEAAPPASAEAAKPATPTEEAEAPPKRFCRPRLMPVRLPEPLGPKLFILGEPVLHKYYTVFDWGEQRVGFSLANSRANTLDRAELRGQKGELPKEVDMLLMQKNMGVKLGGGSRHGLAIAPIGGSGEEIQEEAIFVQVHVRLSVSLRPRIAV